MAAFSECSCETFIYICSELLASPALVLFEHLTTLDCEVRLVRRRRLSYAGAVFLLNRYLALLLFFLSLGPLLPTHNTLVSALTLVGDL